MTLGSYTLGWAFTFLLCFVLFNGAWGDCGPPPVKPNTNPIQETPETVVYTCDRSTSYYEIPGKSVTITCQADGTWTNIEDFCSRACGVPDRISFAEPRPGALNQNIFLPNATVSYVCRPGYTRVFGKKNSLTCLENYKWSEPEVFCQRRACGNPGEVENGNMDATDFLFGSRVTYTCNEGYRLASRRNFRDCQADGTWSNSLPQCDAVICAAPESPADGHYFPKKDEYTYLDSVTFLCQKPLQVAGDASISCTATGKWSSDSPTCKAVNCPNPDVKNSRRLSGFIGPYTLNSAISFECDKCCVLNGSSSISCNIDSQWVPAIPQCETVICAAPESPADGEYFPKKDEYTYLDSVKFLCRKPLQVAGNASISCTATGKWSSDSPTCKEILCGDPGTIQNGQISSSTPDFKVGSKATYTCNEGFAFPLTSKMNYRICQENGAWSDLTLVCTAICKENPHVPPFALLKETSTIYYNGTVVRFECKPGFTSNGKEKTITCRDHSWSDPEEFCTRISCGDPGKIKNGHVSASDYLFGSRVKYTCEEGYVMNTTQNFTECQADGTWSTAIGCKDTSKSEGIGIWTIVGILSVIVAAAALSGACYCLCNLSKKRKTGKLHPETPSVQYSHCTA